MPKFSIKVSDFQKAKMELQKELEKIRPTCHVTVGFHVSKGADREHAVGAQEILDEKQRRLEERLLKRGKSIDDIKRKAPRKNYGLTIVQVARFNHYGTKTIPARAFLDVSLAEKQDYLAHTLRRDLEKGIPIDQALERVGNRAVSVVQSYITDLKTPPNAESTIKNKRSSNPLIDTGLMRGAVTFKVQSE